MSVEEEVAYLIEERFREQYHIIDFPIRAAGLEFGMVVRLSGRLVVVKSIERIEPERVIVNKRHRVLVDQEVVIWQMNNKPF